MLTDDKENQPSESSSEEKDVSAPGTSSGKGEMTLAEAVAAYGKEDKSAPPAEEKEQEESNETAESTETTQEGEQETESEGTAEESKDETQTEAKEPVEEGKKEEGKLPPFHNHPRWKEVVSENKQLKETVSRSQVEIEDLKKYAEPAKALNDFCQRNGISDLDLNTALELAALSHKDERAFVSKLENMLDALKFQQGTKLPADLAKRVDDGTLTEADAKEILTARLAALRAKNSTVQSKQSIKQAEQSVRQAHVRNIESALNQWEKEVRKQDVDYEKNEDFRKLVERNLIDLCKQKYPTSIEMALSYADAAYKDAAEFTSRLKERFAPAAPSRKGLPKNGSPKKVVADEIKQLDNIRDIRKIVDLACSRLKK